MRSKYRICVSIVVTAFAVIRVTAQVSQSWASIYSGAGNGYDDAYGVAVDRAGNTYVTGEVYTGVNSDCLTIKYKSNGDTAWMRFYNGAGNSTDIGWAVAVDASENVYVTGATHTATHNYDIVTIKYDSAGVQQWASTYDGPGHGLDEGNAIAIDDSGNVFITGHSPGTTSSDDYVTIKYNSSGMQQWATRYNGPGSFQDLAHAIVLDDSDNVYITGESSGSGTDYDFATIKYNSAGVQQWAARYDDTAHLNDDAMSIAIDNSHNVYVTGSSQTSISHGGYATVKYNSAGGQQWIARFDGGGGDNAAYALASDGDSGLFVTGAGRNPASPYSYDYLTIRYNASTGDTVWTARYNGPGNGDDYSKAIALDRQGNIFITGYSTGVSSGYDVATLRYNSSGVEQWEETYTTAGSYNDLGTAIAIDTAGGVYVIGTAGSASAYNNFLTIKYEDASLPVELTSFSAAPSGSNVQLTWNTATEVNNAGFDIERRSMKFQSLTQHGTTGSAQSLLNSWATVGFIEGHGTTNAPQRYTYADNVATAGTYSYRLKQIDRDGAFVYSQEVEVAAGSAPRVFSLGQNYPNPFNPSTNIRFTVPFDGRATLKIFNPLGQEVATLFDGTASSGEYHQATFDASRLASGIYFSRLEFDGKMQVKKMMLLK